MKRIMAFFAIILAASTFSVMAEEDIGKTEYMVACAVCHGDSGMGNGPFAELLSVEVPSLTGLAAANDGEFPYLETLMIVDGRTGVRGHGGPMPIWGDRFERDALAEAGFYGSELIARGRLVALVDYLVSIQQ